MNKNLNHSDKNHAFRVPEGYFESLTSNIQSRVFVEEQSKPFTTYSIRWFLAPALCLLLAGFWIISSNESSMNPTVFLAEVSDDAIIEYLEFSELNELELIAMIENANQLYGIDQLENIDFEEESLDKILDEINLNYDYL